MEKRSSGRRKMGNCRFGLEKDQRNVEKWKEEFGWSSKVEDEAE